MTANDITLHAFNGTFPDEPMNMPERLLYYHIKDIALRFKYGEIAKSVASDMKLQAYNDFDADKVAFQNGIDCAHRIADLYKRIELATSAYRLDKTIENADKILEVIYG